MHLLSTFKFEISALIELTHSRRVDEPLDPAVVVCWREAVDEVSDRAGLAFGNIF